jgi:hypothetical protein
MEMSDRFFFFGLSTRSAPELWENEKSRKKKKKSNNRRGQKIKRKKRVGLVHTAIEKSGKVIQFLLCHLNRSFVAPFTLTSSIGVKRRRD